MSRDSTCTYLYFGLCSRLREYRRDFLLVRGNEFSEPHDKPQTLMPNSVLQLLPSYFIASFLLAGHTARLLDRVRGVGIRQPGGGPLGRRGGLRAHRLLPGRAGVPAEQAGLRAQPLPVAAARGRGRHLRGPARLLGARRPGTQFSRKILARKNGSRFNFYSLSCVNYHYQFLNIFFVWGIQSHYASDSHAKAKANFF